jgi:DNA repair protein RecN (Recombination protein N)
MLTELHVRDLGVIRDLTLELGSGMTALTGETGAGKTLLVHALQLVLGGRAAPGLVRAGAREAFVEARFVVGGGRGSQEGAEVIMARSVPVSGRSRAWVDGRMAPVAALAEVGAGMVDIHGQHDQQSLLSVAGQRAALDHFSGADLEPLAAARRARAALLAALAELGGDQRERARQLDLLRYQATEIEAASIAGADEDEALAAEEARLADMTALRGAAADAVALLAGDDLDGTASGASTGVGRAIAALSGWAVLEPWERRLRDVLAELDDAAAELRAAAETWEDDPARLEEVQERRRALSHLRRKYGETLADVIAFGEEARRSLEELERRDQEAAALEAGRAEAEDAVAAAEAALRQVRAAAAPRLAAAVTDRLGSLAMPDAALEVLVGAEGAGDGVQFLLAANRGEPPQPLSRVASGGELARTMLALRLVVEGGAPTMLFDEVDAGVGGTAALALAAALRDVSRRRQVLVVTHLAQVAAFADHQVSVQKAIADGRTLTAAEVLSEERRVVELSRMLSGHPHSATARAHAEELLRAARGAAVSTTAGPGGD